MANVLAELEHGREAYAERAWLAANESLSAADRASPLDADDLELLATSAYMLGHDDEYVAALERAYHEHRAAGRQPRAIRCAFWIGLKLLLHGERARANGWFGRAERALESCGEDCVERGYLLMTTLFERIQAGDHDAAHEIATEMTSIGERFGDADLVVFGLQDQGQALIRQGRASDGLRLLDETMLAVTSGAASPIVSGLVYCNTIAFCQSVYELPRAREWTDALTRWCEGQPDMVAHTGLCLVHRAEIMELSGSWEAALEEARRAHERLAQNMPERVAVGGAIYRQGELHRLRGDFDAAEDAYREAARRGWEPQPGLAFLRLAQGRREAAGAALGRALGEAHEPLARLRLLPAAVEVMLALEQTAAASQACAELETICAGHPAGGVPEALALQARGAVELAGGDAQTALTALRRSFRLWSELDIPYEAARTRELVGRACKALGDAESADLELEAAHAAFEVLGARADVARIDGPPEAAAHGLTDRELEVLRLVAAGKSNRAIADELVISEHTVARHLQNMFAKLGVSSRTAASAFAFEHHLV